MTIELVDLPIEPVGFSIVFGTFTTWFSPEKFPGLTVANRSVFGFTAIALGDGFLVPSHTTGGIYVMEARPIRARCRKTWRKTWENHGEIHYQWRFWMGK